MGDKPVRSLRTVAYDSLLELLSEFRAESGLTQLQICQKLGQEATYVSKIERGTRRLDVIEFIEIVRAMGIEPNEAFRRLTAKI